MMESTPGFSEQHADTADVLLHISVAIAAMQLHEKCNYVYD